MTVPFLETRPRAGTRRLLLVSYAFPPDATVGALRWEMMLRFAADFGWTADVLLMDPIDSLDADEARLATLPSGLRLFGIPFQGVRFDAFLRWINRMVVPSRPQPDALDEFSDAVDRGASTEKGLALGRRLEQLKRNVWAWKYYAGWMRWARDAASVGIQLARETEYACVVSSGPPHTAHEAARRIAKAISRPLIIDFRDPWTSDDAAPNDMRGRKWTSVSNRLESACIAAAALITVNTESAARLMRGKYPADAQRIITVMNGADPVVAPSAFPTKPFTVSYAGSLYGGRRPQALFRALSLVVKREKLSPDDIRLHFMGVGSPQRAPLIELARRESVEEYFLCETRRPRIEAQSLLDRSAMLVLLPQVHVHSIPAKVFEYVQRRVWILVLSESPSAIVELLGDTAADVVSPNDVEGIADAIARRFKEARNGTVPESLNADGRFSREHQSRLFFRELDRVLTSTHPAELVGSAAAGISASDSHSSPFDET